MSSGKHCPYDHDCLHCPAPDCICSDRMTKQESEIMKGAHGGWDLEIRVKRIAFMLNHRVPMEVMFELLGITKSQYSHEHKKAALLLQKEKRQKTNTTKNNTLD